MIKKIIDFIGSNLPTVLLVVVIALFFLFVILQATGVVDK